MDGYNEYNLESYMQSIYHNLKKEPKLKNDDVTRPECNITHIFRP